MAAILTRESRPGKFAGLTLPTDLAGQLLGLSVPAHLHDMGSTFPPVRITRVQRAWDVLRA